MKRILLATTVAVLAYLLFWPVPIDPVAWDAPEAPELAGPYATNDRLADVERVGETVGVGPEEVIADDDGYLYTGYEDGRIVRLDADGDNPEVIADTGGRPFGMAFDANDDLIVADGYEGLLRVTLDGDIEVLTTEAGGVPFRFTNNLDIASDGTIYFSDASSKFGPAMKARDDVFEHGGHGRLLAFDPDTGDTTVLLDGLQFANGVALAPDEASVLVAETGRYTIVRYWLEGERAGEDELFYENLPGIPDNLSSNGEDTYWLALFAPRNAALDAMSEYPFLRRVAFRLPEVLQPQPAAHAFVLGLSLDGEVTHNLQDTGDDSFHPVTGAVEADGRLYLGSLEEGAIGVIDVPEPTE
ncbi:SMP-30/gluconolactonase/LRE family protein [Aquisalimonas asiatica]|uniref:Sugar lactone lactonase YvrE n=1 Tax=Aquisalimonas asiatica TaxID=406100 RepID=A0A1H8PPQ4_9GAMM|nr:SMP-30/gluconolactonase/LRE family protein [Aquisalimonas asiatica]SEO43697.1 Sugar lactone lactonase YvrE [Aquisalimonas asiatica]